MRNINWLEKSPNEEPKHLYTLMNLDNIIESKKTKYGGHV
jgi:hypothetical protein